MRPGHNLVGPAFGGRKKRKKPQRKSVTTANLKVCLICLRRYDEHKRPRAPTPPLVIPAPAEEVEVIDITEEDPLSDAILKYHCSKSKDDKPTPPPPEPEVTEVDKKGVYLNFLKIVSRYLKIKTKRFRNAAEEHEDEPPLCIECFDRVETLCDEFREWEERNMKMKWRLGGIAKAVQLSNSKVSGKLGVALLKSLSKQLHIFSCRGVDLLRKQLSLKCSIKTKDLTAVPAVSLDKDFCAKYATSRLKFPIRQMEGYLKSLIVVFALAVPQKEPQPEHPSRTHKNRGVRVKKELMGASNDNEDDGFDGTSPPASPLSPGSENDKDDGDEDDTLLRGSDSDWSGNDVPISVPTVSRRWNLRKRRSITNDKDKENEGNEDTECLSLPPLRRRNNTSTVEGERKFPCNICNLRFLTDNGLQRHIRQVHTFISQYNCKLCPQLRFKKKMLLDLHMKKAHPRQGPTAGRCSAQKSTCRYCQKEFPSKIKLAIHKRHAHKAELGSYTCEVCGKIVKCQFRYEKHIRSHESKPFECTTSNCSRKFSTEEDLKIHLEFHQNNPDWTPSKSKQKEVKLKKEKRIYKSRLSALPFKCEISDCGREFREESNLKIHLTLHSSSYSCSVCNQEFTQVNDLRSHLEKVHETQEIFHYCLHCVKGFTQKQSLEFHIKVGHPSLAKLVCDVDYCMEEFDPTCTEELREHLKKAHLSPDILEVVEKVESFGIFGSKLKDNQIKKNENGDDKPINATTSVPPPVVNPSSEASSAPIGTTAIPASGSSNDSEEKPEIAATTDDSATASLPIIAFIANPDEMKSDCKPEQDETLIENTSLGLYTCERCKWSFTSMIALSLHFVVHGAIKGGRYQCKLCPESFRVLGTLQTHYNCQHGPNIKLLLCTICGQRFHRQESYNLHMDVHDEAKKSESKKYECKHCPETFDCRTSFFKHSVTHRGIKSVRKPRGGGEEEILQCDQCAKTFTRTIAMLNHQFLEHGREKPFKCDAEGCNKAFFTRNRLQFHKLIHREASFLCPMCPEKFSRKANFDYHMMVHSGQKDHICHLCGNAYYKLQQLQKHMVSHEEKKFKCSYCEKTFHHKDAQKSHERSHTREKRWPCRICGEMFVHCSSRKFHENRHKKEGELGPIQGHSAKKESAEEKVRKKPGRKPKNKNVPSDVENEIKDESIESTTGELNGIPIPSTASASGIIHEALQAAFNDGLDMPSHLLEPNKIEDYGHDRQDILNSIEVFVYNNDGTIKKEESPASVPEGVLTRKRKGRPPKVSNEEKVESDLTCGFCGKTFRREKPFKAHMERHLSLDALLDTSTSSKNTQASGTPVETPSRNLLDSARERRRNRFQKQEDMPSPEPPRKSGTRSSKADYAAAFTSIMSTIGQNTSSQRAVNPEPPVKKRRGRPPKDNVEPPGSRIARIVDDVMERQEQSHQHNTRRRTSAAATDTGNQNQTTHQIQQQSFHPAHDQSGMHHQQIQSPHQMVESPSPHSMIQSPPPSQNFQAQSPHSYVQSGSERSTPTMSPAPGQNLNFHQPTTSSATFPPSSFLNPFLFSNPYLLPRQDTMQNQQQQVAGQLYQQGGRINSQLPQQHLTIQQSEYSGYVQQPNLVNQQGSVPQDLSKSSYPMFFANQQR